VRPGDLVKVKHACFLLDVERDDGYGLTVLTGELGIVISIRELTVLQGTADGHDSMKKRPAQCATLFFGDLIVTTTISRVLSYARVITLHPTYTEGAL
jgi:hypothetical protein